MLCAQRLFFVDTAEEQGQWRERLTRQWGDTLAVRFRNNEDFILGSSVPGHVVFHDPPDSVTPSWWGVSWQLECETLTRHSPSKTSAPENVVPHSSKEEERDVSDRMARGTIDAPMASCVEVPLERVPDSIVAVEIITMSGDVRATFILDLSSFRQDLDGGLRCQTSRSTLFLTPTITGSVDEPIIHGLLEYTVVHDASAAYLSAKAEIPIPTPIRRGPVAFSTLDCFFPSMLLSSPGMYVISNVICLENHAKNRIAVECVSTDSRLLRLMPQKLILEEQGSKAYVVCTWSIFEKFNSQNLSAHLILNEAGQEDAVSIRLNLHGEPPGGGTAPQFLLWINSTMATNAPCSIQERTQISSSLPIFSIANSSVTGQ